MPDSAHSNQCTQTEQSARNARSLPSDAKPYAFSKAHIRPVIILAILAFCPNLAALESCDPNDLNLPPGDAHPEHLFYVGTCNYRNKDYAEAARLWNKLLETQGIDSEYHPLQVSAHNNLGYLLFYGYGVSENKIEALNHWNKAISMGHTESEFHLCHAYADTDEPTYDPVKARLHCNKAELIYKGIEERDEIQEDILAIIKKYQRQLSE